jgi:hypothetical protein
MNTAATNAPAMNTREQQQKGGERLSRTYRLPRRVIEALDKLAEQNRRPVTTELLIALENHLWPDAGKDKKGEKTEELVFSEDGD